MCGLKWNCIVSTWLKELPGLEYMQWFSENFPREERGTKALWLSEMKNMQVCWIPYPAGGWWFTYWPSRRARLKKYLAWGYEVWTMSNTIHTV